MIRRTITDKVWIQLLNTMTTHGCYDAKNSRDVMEAILWKLRTGAPWGDMFHMSFVHGRRLLAALTLGPRKGCGRSFFLSCEAKLIRNGCSSMEVISALGGGHPKVTPAPMTVGADHKIDLRPRRK